MGLGHMVPNPNLEYKKVVVVVGEGVLKDKSFDWATITLEKLVSEEVFAIRMVITKACAE
jgi:hypothetical protein